MNARTKLIRRNRWLKALRSGKYKQGQDTLRSGTEQKSLFCCLGVYCDVNPSVGKWRYEERDSTWEMIMKNEDGDESIVTSDFAGIANVIGLDEDQHNFLVLHNDGSPDTKLNPNAERWNFSQIADWIEENV